MLKHEFTTDKATDFTAILTTRRGVAGCPVLRRHWTQAVPDQPSSSAGHQGHGDGRRQLCTEKPPELARGSVTGWCRAPKPVVLRASSRLRKKRSGAV